MDEDSQARFRLHFEQLTSRKPYPWQESLFAALAHRANEWPEVVDLPTGAGKTAVLHVWLLALADSVWKSTYHVPRRLAWVVNRRVVVDQVTTEVEVLLKPDDGLDKCPEVKSLLASLSRSGTALAASTLRGARADNGDWARDPSTPAIVVGTVDMIGSRLLFRGYRSGRYHRPIHAGLLGVDTLIVNDESHLSHAFGCLLASVDHCRPAAAISGKTFRYMLLSATPSEQERRRFQHDPETDAAASEHFRKLFTAPKRLTVVEVEGPKADALRRKLATDPGAARTVVFLEKPEDALKFASWLLKEGHLCSLLTGTMRGLERDALLQDPAFKCFLEQTPTPERVWLVATSAGEVGVNLTCERMITDLVSADKLLQRFGRLNRFGLSDGAEAFVLHRTGAEKDAKLAASLEYLKELGSDLSVRSVWNKRPPAAACEDKPTTARLHRSLLDVWAQTTYRDRDVMEAVEPYLHGKQESWAETEIAWRSDIDILLGWGKDAAAIELALESFPVLPHERLREPSSRVKKKLDELAELTEAQCVLVDADGTCHIRSLAKIRGERDDSSLRYRLVILPPGVGHISKFGMFEVAGASDDDRYDVAEKVDPRRYRLRRANGVVEAIGEWQSFPDGFTPELLIAAPDAYGFKPPVLVEEPDDEDGENGLIYLAARAQRSRTAAQDVLLKDHLPRVAETAKALAKSLKFDEELCAELRRAGELHDLGKAREVWQRAMGKTLEFPCAKVKKAANPSLIARYRHELGSLVELAVKGVPASELAKHIVAAHHAGARPFFESDQYDREYLAQSAEAAMECARRFGRLQEHYGHWGLAYLESILKCGDGLASAEEGDGQSA